MNRFVSIGIAFATGAIAGAITGILLAPEKGSNTRENLAKRARAFEEDFKDFTTSCKDVARDKTEKLMKEAETVFSN